MAIGGPEVSIAITADTKEVTAQIAQVTQEVTLMGKSLNASNDIGVQAWKNSAAAGKDYLNTVGATTLQHAKFDAAVRTTQQHLDGMSTAAEHGTRNLGFFSALQSEAAGHVGEHSLAIGRLERNLASFGERSLGINSTLGLLTTSLGKFAIGSIEITAALIGIDALIAAYDKITEGARKAADAQMALADAIGVRFRPKTGKGSEIYDQYEALVRQKADDIRHLAMLRGASNDFGVAKAYHAAGEQVPFGTRDDLIKAAEADLIRRNNELHDIYAEGGGGKLQTVTTRSDEKKDDAEANKVFLAQLHDANRIGTAAINAVNDMLKDAADAVKFEGDLQAKLQDQLSTARDLGSVYDKRIDQATKIRDLTFEEIERKSEEDPDLVRRALFRDHELAVATEIYNLTLKQIEAERNKAVAKDTKDIEKIGEHHDPSGIKAIMDRANQDVETINAKVADVIDKASKTAEGMHQIANAAASAAKSTNAVWQAALFDIAGVGANAFDKLAKSMQKAGIVGVGAARTAADAMRIYRIAVIGKEAFIEGKKEGAAAIKSFAEHDLAGAAGHTMASAAYFATAAEAAIEAGSGGGGGGSSGGGGGSSSGLGASFGAGNTNQDQTIKIEIVTVQKDQTGREVARTNQTIQRLHDLNTPIRVTL